MRAPVRSGTPAITASWPARDLLGPVAVELAAKPPLVHIAGCLDLRAHLAKVAQAEAIVLQGGDCAELFAEVSCAATAAKAAQLHALGTLLERGTALPAIRIGRLAGQFAKPRSQPMELGPDGTALRAYYGDAVNGLEANLEARTPDPARMLLAYAKSAEVIAHLRQYGDSTASPPLYTSHEALLCEYEYPLIRQDPASGLSYGSSAHLLWVGHRTRDPFGEHVSLLARLANPVAVKLGPGVTAEDVTVLVDRLDPEREPGRLAFIARFGADRVDDLLPSLVAAARAAGAQPVWLCDPMHENTLRTDSGRKTRLVSMVRREVIGFVRVLRSMRVHPGGLHLELSPHDVTECIGPSGESLSDALLPRYRSACDPRLNPAQAYEVVNTFIEEL
jgi:3-deoxy-7-phosphoheptulonate synthase